MILADIGRVRWSATLVLAIVGLTQAFRNFDVSGDHNFHRNKRMLGSWFAHLFYNVRASEENLIEDDAHVIMDKPKDCLFMSSEAGYFTYESTFYKDTVCGVYLFADPDEILEVTFTQFDVPCIYGKIGGLVSFVDGWELNGKYFPSPEDHKIPLKRRISEFCGSKPSRVFVSSQNGALIQYRIPQKGKGFKIFVRHIKHPQPCNIIATEAPNYTLRNYYHNGNCSLWAPYATAVKINSYRIGSSRRRFWKTSSNCECGKSYSEDKVLIGGSSGLDTADLEVFDTVCGTGSCAEEPEIILSCEISTIKLRSSGIYDNAVDISLRSALPEEIPNSKYFCGLQTR